MSSYVYCRMSSYPHLKGSFANVNDENLSLVSSQICNRFFQFSLNLITQVFSSNLLPLSKIRQQNFLPHSTISFPQKKSNNIKMDADWTRSTQDFSQLRT